MDPQSGSVSEETENIPKAASSLPSATRATVRKSGNTNDELKTTLNKCRGRSLIQGVEGNNLLTAPAAT